jgi:hypothetical protein
MINPVMFTRMRTLFICMLQPLLHHP